jgi:tetratricopeptide (TPR) repeat protein
MKIKLLITGLLGLVSVASFAQKRELSNAKDKYDAYNVERGNKLTMVQGVKDIQEAKASIDKASVDPKTGPLAQTYTLKASIYSSLTIDDSVPSTSLPNYKIAYEALLKAKSLDSAKQDKDNEKYMQNAQLNLAQYMFNKGRAEFQNKKYEDAYQSFSAFHSLRPADDTLSLYVTGLAAANAGATNPKFYSNAIASYSKLVTTPYSQNQTVFYDLGNIYLATKDTADAFKTIGAGVAKYPDNKDLRRREIEIGLQSGQQDALIGKIESAISNDPKNKTLYYYEGLTYSQIAESIEAKEAKTKDAAAKSALDVKKVDNFNKAADQYKKAIALDPDYFEANLNLGYVIIKPAIDDYNAANLLPSNQQKAYDAAIAKANAEFAPAKPYLQKAVELNPKSVDALENLKEFYLGTKDPTDANATEVKIKALGGD